MNMLIKVGDCEVNMDVQFPDKYMPSGRDPSPPPKFLENMGHVYGAILIQLANKGVIKLLDPAHG